MAVFTEIFSETEAKIARRKFIHMLIYKVTNFCKDSEKQVHCVMENHKLAATAQVLKLHTIL